MTTIDYGALMLHEAARDHAAEAHEARFKTARTAALAYWPTLASATSEVDYGFRVAYLRQRIEAAMVESGVTDSVVHEEVLASLAQDYQIMTGKKAEDLAEGDRVLPSVVDSENFGQTFVVKSVSEDEGRVKVTFTDGTYTHHDKGADVPVEKEASKKTAEAETSRKVASAPALPLIKGFSQGGAHYSMHGYLTEGSPLEYWVARDGEFEQIDEGVYQAALAEARQRDPYGNMSRRTSGSPKEMVCFDCNGTGAIPSGGWEDPSEVDENGYVRCPTCGGAGTLPGTMRSFATASAPRRTSALLGRVD